ncbi:response regulator transcription factor [Paenibacillus albiflavus]|uniref:Heme response regulator HssR n=1 Tax=Paenibacillus albiflavus TaxID=2545760 RepID=A0A4R4E9Q2_9BACL|nr:response regulator transcription factor [Paenibacillus albiflavus]TCZ76586.1 response regulator transcription factor [Paenibacillus albiflavus]
MSIQILVADDDPHIRELVSLMLKREGYGVHEAEDGGHAANILEQENIHLAVIDVMMPVKNGWQLVEEIRGHYDIPVILLTAKGQAKDIETGFLAGTDDYMIKPFEPKELLFRIKALLRRYRMVSSEVIKLNNTTINRKSYEVIHGGEIETLPLKEFELLSQLASFPGQIFTREQLVELIWGADFNGDNRTVDVHIKRLRERFARNTDDFVITTVRGIGYKLEVQES